MPAHRASWEIFRGPIPESFGGGAKVCVCHKCDVPACVNPDHLFLGRSADNNRDRDRKGRQARGERSGSRLYPEKHRGVLQGRRAKLNDQKVRDIRSLYAAGGWRFEDLAQKFGVSDSCIDFVVNKRSWKHVVEGGLS